MDCSPGAHLEMVYLEMVQKDEAMFVAKIFRLGAEVSIDVISDDVRCTTWLRGSIY